MLPRLPPKLVIPGGSGQVGTLLARHFHGQGHEVVVLSRRPITVPWRVVAWDGRTLGPWADEVDGAAAVINLAGRSVNCRYTPANRREILESRVSTTRVVGEAIARARRPPRVWLQASTATIYAHRFDAPNDEDGPLGGSEPDVPSLWHFSIEVGRRRQHRQPAPGTQCRIHAGAAAGLGRAAWPAGPGVAAGSWSLRAPHRD